MYQGSSSGLLVSCCPGPGNGWGNLTVPPASKEAVSPSKPILYSVFCRGGVGGRIKETARGLKLGLQLGFR